MIKFTKTPLFSFSFRLYNKSMLKKQLIFISLLFITLYVFLLSPTQVKAIPVTPNGSAADSIRELYGTDVIDAIKHLRSHQEALENCAEGNGQNLQCQQAAAQQSVAATTFCSIVGCQSTRSAVITQDNGVYSEFLSKGAINATMQLTAQLYNKPASSQTYIADVLNNAHIVPSVHAQGIGFEALTPILGIWKVCRDVAYLFFVVIFVVLAFLIIFRHKVGQSAITAQQAIPSVIIALVFVTFSYAIAGLLIDLMYLFMYIIIRLFNAPDALLDLTPISLGEKLITGRGNQVTSVNKAIVDFVGQVGENIGGDAGKILGWVSSLTLMAIISIAVLIGVFKLFLELLKTYITIIISVIFSPLVLMMGAIPGNNPFWPWIKSLIANLAAYPTVLILVIMYEILAQRISDYDKMGGFMPPFLLGGGQGGAVSTLVGLGIILSIPKAVKEIKSALGAKDGVFAGLMTSGWNQFKEGMPLGGRIGGTATLGAAGMAGGFAGGLAGGSYKALQYIARGRPISAASQIATPFIGAYQGAKFGPHSKKAKLQTALVRGLRPAGASSPQLFHPLEQAIDQRTLTATAKKREKELAEAEEAQQPLLNAIRRGKTS